MNYLLTLLLVTSAASTEQEFSEFFVKPIQIFSNQKEMTYEELHDEALFDCPFASPDGKKQKIIEVLIEVEKSHNLPSSLRGMLLAAACHESGYNPEAKGDHKFSKKRKPMAIGLFQMWPWWEGAPYKVDRRNPRQSADVYLIHVKSKLERVKYFCRHRSVERMWLTAWATAIRAPKASGRCGEIPKFYYILKRWHKSIKDSRQTDDSCTEHDGCGC